MNEFLKAIQNRRSIYCLTNETLLSDVELQNLIETAVMHVPSSFHSQNSRVVLVTGISHKKLWDITLEKLKAIVPAEKFQPTKAKIASFAAGYGTILYFEDHDTVQQLQEKFPTYAVNFPIWSQQTAGMLQFIIWTALELEGMGASLQHYNPLIDEAVSKAFATPKSWKLLAQMPFGKPCAQAGKKTFLPIESRVKTFR